MNAVQELRRSAGLTQTVLAELADVSQATISRYEAGSRTPTLAMLSRLAEAVDLRAVVLYVPMPGRHQRWATTPNGEIAAEEADEEADASQVHESTMKSTPTSPSSR